MVCDDRISAMGTSCWFCLGVATRWAPMIVCFVRRDGALESSSSSFSAAAAAAAEAGGSSPASMSFVVTRESGCCSRSMGLVRNAMRRASGVVALRRRDCARSFFDDAAVDDRTSCSELPLRRLLTAAASGRDDDDDDAFAADLGRGCCWVAFAFAGCCCCSSSLVRAWATSLRNFGLSKASKMTAPSTTAGTKEWWPTVTTSGPTPQWLMDLIWLAVRNAAHSASTRALRRPSGTPRATSVPRTVRWRTLWTAWSLGFAPWTSTEFRP
mmetsp:Transcript_2456/g.8321  ORF Transcript_2456/g.8321 Transcript_2456/m.8321 type:complete len:269 (-) Transcript_2456:2661-3467(-)